MTIHDAMTICYPPRTVYTLTNEDLGLLPQRMTICYPPRTVYTCASCGGERATGEPHVCQSRRGGKYAVGQKVWLYNGPTIQEVVITSIRFCGDIIFCGAVYASSPDVEAGESLMEHELFAQDAEGRERLNQRVRVSIWSLEHQLKTLNEMELPCT